ncbi:MAG TPA: helicase C-terminal domain-containing protein [Thermoanaerobaculia bacterium]|nr:helicase C-terminal domain-containing protein [Thermoanaerobaculia bacterium]
MATRFDGERLTLDLAVADLVEGSAERHLGFANRGGYERLWLGQAIHSRYQEEALAGDGSYRREVVLDLTFGHRGWEVTVHGRADGLRRDPDGVLVVEEIKSVRRGGGLAPALRELYEQQARLYAWMLARRDDVDVRAELVLIEIGGEGSERIPVEVPLAAVEAGVKRRLNGLLRAWEAERMAAMARREAGARLAFPYAELRPGQEDITAAVETALDHREHLLLQAPTGLGKTVAALYPALRHCLAHDKRLFVLTAKTTQQEMARTVLGLLNREGAFRSLTLRAKAKMCANDQVICHEEYCPYARDYHAKLGSSQVLRRLVAEHPALDPETVFDHARAAEVCPFEVSLELAGRVQVVVCDYNYVFDPYVGLADFAAGEDLSDTVLVIDELHNLVDRGRGYYSPVLAADAARRAAEWAATAGGAPVHRRTADLCLRLAARVEEAVAEALGEVPGQPPPPSDGMARAVETRLPEDELFLARRELDAAFVDLLEHNREHKSFRADDPFVAFYFDYLRFLNGLAVSDHAFSHCAERVAPEGGRRAGRTGARLRVLCKDPSRFLGATIGRTHSTIGLSATLSPAELYRDLLGFGAGRTAAVAVPSPFPAENRRVVIDATVATAWRERAGYARRIGERLAAFADAVPGNCLALFPSYGFLAQVAAEMPEVGKRLLVQHSGAGDGERDLILDALRRSLFGDVLLLAVAGGVFAEGVDYPGDALRAVAIVGPCLPALSLEQQLLRAFYDERFDRGFEYAYVVPGMTRVVQAAGRLIRSADDAGVIALLDRRFLERPYRDHLPAEWLPEEGAGALAGDPAEVAAAFFAERGLGALRLGGGPAAAPQRSAARVRRKG